MLGKVFDFLMKHLQIILTLVFLIILCFMVGSVYGKFQAAVKAGTDRRTRCELSCYPQGLKTIDNSGNCVCDATVTVIKPK